MARKKKIRRQWPEFASSKTYQAATTSTTNQVTASNKLKHVSPSNQAGTRHP